MIKLRTVIDLIVEGDTERSFRRYKNHHLQGQYKSCQGCHIEPGWLLIHKIDNKRLTLILTRTGSHNDLFKEWRKARILFLKHRTDGVFWLRPLASNRF